jgi:hypothetical protein
MHCPKMFDMHDIVLKIDLKLKTVPTKSYFCQLSPSHDPLTFYQF